MSAAGARDLSQAPIVPRAVYAAARESFEIVVRDHLEKLGRTADPQRIKGLLFAWLPMLDHGWSLKHMRVKYQGENIHGQPIWLVERQ